MRRRCVDAAARTTHSQPSPLAGLTQAIRAAQGIVAAAKDGLSYTVAYSPHTQCTILSFAVVSLIKVGRASVGTERRADLFFPANP